MPAQCPKTKQNQITKGTITLGKEGSEIKAEKKKKEKPIIDPVLSCLAAHQGPILSGPAIASSSFFLWPLASVSTTTKCQSPPAGEPRR